jgi:fumarate hydratase class II
MDYRIEKDTMGEVKVPVDAYYGAQTQRSIDNFRIAQDINRMPREIIRAFAFLKKAESTRMLTVLEPINFQEEYQYIEQLIHDITFVLNNRQI